MYIELTGEGHRIEWARIGRVSFSKTGKTLYYNGFSLAGMGRAWCRDVESGDPYGIQAARQDGRDRGGKNKRGSFRVQIDDDVRQKYWSEIRRRPNRSHERVTYS
jgi:hypothetical protein